MGYDYKTVLHQFALLNKSHEEVEKMTGWVKPEVNRRWLDMGFYLCGTLPIYCDPRGDNTSFEFLLG